MCAFGFYSDLFETGKYEVVGNYSVTIVQAFALISTND